MDYRLRIWPRYVLEWDNRRLALPSRLGIVLSRLVSRHPATSEDLFDSLYGDREDGGPDNAKNTVNVALCQLRKRLKDTPFHVERVRDHQYRFTERITKALDDIADNVLDP